ncbi:MAG TPA: MoaD/ThiS family protein [Spirochaetales bacterium]|nr:MoaD/ThiS family protein [Spirochaetales bacterium]HRY53219.1 MoaD/ThiS family protein [Spirochaetia bacterium]HRZ63648.1 MoaD/ThiS family protein [Spirochaetia bacterium]
MKVRVFAPAFGDDACLDREGMLELPEGARLGEVLAALKVPFPLSRLPLCMVNYRRAKPSTPLAEGDIVSFFSIVSGG